MIIIFLTFCTNYVESCFDRCLWDGWLCVSVFLVFIHAGLVHYTVYVTSYLVEKFINMFVNIFTYRAALGALPCEKLTFN